MKNVKEYLKYISENAKNLKDNVIDYDEYCENAVYILTELRGYCEIHIGKYSKKIQ